MIYYYIEKNPGDWNADKLNLCPPNLDSFHAENENDGEGFDKYFLPLQCLHEKVTFSR